MRTWTSWSNSTSNSDTSSTVLPAPPVVAGVWLPEGWSGLPRRGGGPGRADDGTPRRAAATVGIVLACFVWRWCVFVCRGGGMPGGHVADMANAHQKRCLVAKDRNPVCDAHAVCPYLPPPPKPRAGRTDEWPTCLALGSCKAVVAAASGHCGWGCGWE